MVNMLAPPPGTPDPAAQQLIDGISEYLRATRDPLVALRGIRHIARHADTGIAQAIADARTRSCTWTQIADVSGMAMGTAQDRSAEARGVQPRVRIRRSDMPRQTGRTLQ